MPLSFEKAGEGISRGKKSQGMGNVILCSLRSGTDILACCNVLHSTTGLSRLEEYVYLHHTDEEDEVGTWTYQTARSHKVLSLSIHAHFPRSSLTG